VKNYVAFFLLQNIGFFNLRVFSVFGHQNPCLDPDLPKACRIRIQTWPYIGEQENKNKTDVKKLVPVPCCRRSNNFRLPRYLSGFRLISLAQSN
jgi:hypothetical protein